MTQRPAVLHPEVAGGQPVPARWRARVCCVVRAAQEVWRATVAAELLLLLLLLRLLLRRLGPKSSPTNHELQSVNITKTKELKQQRT